VADDIRILPPSQKTIYSFKLVVGRDINSREIAFPGRESQFPGLDRFRPRTYLRRNSPSPPLDATRQLVVVAGARRMGVFNGGQRSGLRRRGACVEPWAGKATERRGKLGNAIVDVDHTPGTGDHKPAVIRGRSAHLMSALTRL